MCFSCVRGALKGARFWKRSSRGHPFGIGQGEWVFGCCFPWVETMLGSELDAWEKVDSVINCMFGG